MKLLRMKLVALLSFFFILFPAAQAAELALPSSDLVAPVIEHIPIEKDIYAGQQVDIKATVTDDMGVKNVTLFYRDAGADEYMSLKMNRDLDSFIYTTQLATINSPGLEYYIRAADLAGNMLSFGFSFSPITLPVLPELEPAGNATTLAIGGGDVEKEKSGISKWVWIGLGVVAVGAALSSGGGGNDSNPPSTTTVTIGGCLPPTAC